MANLFSPAQGRREFLKIALGGTALGAFSARPFAALAQTMAGEKMKIATIGAGREGGALGTLFAKAGHPVMFSSRKPEELKDLVASAGPTARAGTVAEAVEFGEIVLLVVPYGAIEQIGKDYGKALATKPLVIDVSNPIARRDGDDLVKSVEQQGGAGPRHGEARPRRASRARLQRHQLRGAVERCKSARRAAWHPHGGGRSEGDRARDPADQGDRLRGGPRGWPRERQISRSGNAARG